MTNNTPHSYEVIKIKLLDAPMTAKKESSVNDKERLSNNFIDVAKLLNGVEKSKGISHYGKLDLKGHPQK